MKNDLKEVHPHEIELKLALPPASDPNSVVKILSATGVLARGNASSTEMHNVYYDTPDQTLRKNRIALRVRRVDSGMKTTWLQTLKMGGGNDTALSDRNEWEVPLVSAKPTMTALKETPWSSIDPDGTKFAALEPCLKTQFNRTRWLVRKRGGSLVEVALDIGKISVGLKVEPICEIELELLQGHRSALFDIANRIAKTLAVLPSTLSKAERGYAIKDCQPNGPTSARPIKLTSGLAVAEAALLVLRENFSQFTANLNALHHSEDPEVVHQARVGWRRFESAYRLFKPVLAQQPKPQWQALSTLLKGLSDLRNLDVARVETLPRLEAEYVGNDLLHGKQWAKLTRLLTRAANTQRLAVRDALKNPAVGAAILTLVQSIEQGGKLGLGAKENSHVEALRPWAKKRMCHLHKKLTESLKRGAERDAQHRSRILAKRMRYGLESLGPLLSARRARSWHQEAVNLQERIGANRDMAQAVKIVSKLKVDRDLMAFLTSHC